MYVKRGKRGKNINDQIASKFYRSINVITYEKEEKRKNNDNDLTIFWCSLLLVTKTDVGPLKKSSKRLSFDRNTMDLSCDV